MPSAAYLSAINARVNDDQLIGMFHVDHPDLDANEWPDGIRLCDYSENITVDGIEYIAWAFRWKRPDRRPDRPPAIPIEIDNVDPRIMRELLALTTSPTVNIWTVLESSPEITEEGPMVFDLQVAAADRFNIRAQLGVEPMLWMKYGRYTFNPMHTPGVFR